MDEAAKRETDEAAEREKEEAERREREEVVMRAAEETAKAHYGVIESMLLERGIKMEKVYPAEVTDRLGKLHQEVVDLLGYDLVPVLGQTEPGKLFDLCCK